LINQKDAYFGVVTNIANSSRLQRDIPDYVLRKPENLDNEGVTGSLDYSWVFSLDDISGSSTTAEATYTSGSRVNETSLTAQSSYEAVLDAGFNKFTTMLNGGFEGLNILEKTPRTTMPSHQSSEQSMRLLTRMLLTVISCRFPALPTRLLPENSWKLLRTEAMSSR